MKVKAAKLQVLFSLQLVSSVIILLEPWILAFSSSHTIAIKFQAGHAQNIKVEISNEPRCFFVPSDCFQTFVEFFIAFTIADCDW